MRIDSSKTGPLAVVRWLGVVVLAVVCLFGLDAARMPFRVVGDTQFLAGTAARFDAWKSDAPDPRWGGCRLGAVDRAPAQITLHLVCEDAADVAVTLTPATSYGLPAPPEDCAGSTAAASWLRCALDGAPTPDRATALRAVVARNLDAILPLVSASRPLVSDLRPDDDRLRLTRPLGWSRTDAGQALTTFLLCGFLWLSVTGRFDPRGWSSRDAWVLVPLTASALLRLVVCPRSLQEIEVFLYDGVVPNKHSYLAPLLGRVLRLLPGDPHAHEFTLAGVLGVLATVPLYRFVAARTGSAQAGAVVAMAVACQPLSARFTPTDGPYGLMMLAFFQAVYWLGVPTSTSVVAGAVSLAIAVACRSDGFLLIPVAALMVGPSVWVELLSARRRATLLGLVAATPVLWLHATTVLPSLWGSSGAITQHTSTLLQNPRSILTDTWWAGAHHGETHDEGVARRVWQGLAVLGGAAAVLRPSLRWGLAALVGGPILAVFYPNSWGWVVAMHRLVPSATVLAVASGAALAAVVVGLDAVRPRWATVVTVALLAVPVALVSTSSAFLTRLWSFNVEWEMVRTALAPGGVERPECAVLAFGALDGGDLDIHDFGQLLYATEVVDCRVVDCVARAQDGGCYRYVRALGAYNADYPLDAACRAPGLTAAEAVAHCRVPACVAVEAALAVRPMVERTIAPDESYRLQPTLASYPTIAVIGVYEVGPTR